MDHGCLIGDCRKIGDSFHFEIRNQRDIRGMFRIHDQDTALALLKASGTRHSEDGQRWFVEAVSETTGLPPSVLWIDAIEGESWDVYACRVRRMSSAGVIAGRYQLGIRADSQDSRLETRASVWRIDNVPKSWQFDAVDELLEKLGFSQVEVIAKESRKHFTSWLLRAKHDGPDVVMQPMVSVHDCPDILELAITKEARRRQVNPKAVKLKQEKRIVFPLAQSPQPPPKRTVQSPAPTTALQLEQEDSEMEADSVKRPKLLGAEPKAAAKPDHNSNRDYGRWMLREGTRQYNPGTGDCLFYAVQQALQVLEPTKSRTARQVRAFTAAFTERHKAEYAALWDGRAPGSNSPDDEQAWEGSFDDYLAGIRLNGCWATYLECFALAAGLQRDIVMLTETGEVWHFPHEGHDPAVCLYFDTAIGHYEYLAGPVEKELRSWAKRHEGPSAPKAAGGGGSANRPASIRLSLFASTPPRSLQLSNFATPKCKSVKRSSIRLSEFSSRPPRSVQLSNLASSTCKSVKRSIGKAKSGCSAPAHANKEPLVDEPSFQWTCQKCNRVLGAATSKQLVLPAKTTLQGHIQTCPAAYSATCGMPMWISPTYHWHFKPGHVATAAKALPTTSSAKRFGMQPGDMSRFVEANVPACNKIESASCKVAKV